MRRILKYGIYGAVIFLSLVVILPFMLYIPVIQQFVQKQVTRIVSEKTGYDISIGKISLLFPLTLETNNAIVISPDGDTLLQSGSFATSIKLLPLFKKEVSIRNLDLKKTRVNYQDTTSGFKLNADITLLSLSPNTINLNNNVIDLSTLLISQGSIYLKIGNSKPDTVGDTSKQINWNIKANELTLQQINFDMTMDQADMKATVYALEGNKCEISLLEQTVDVGRVSLDRADLNYLTEPEAEIKREPTTADTTDTKKSLPWTIWVGHIDIQDTRARYGYKNYQPSAGFDPHYIAVEKVNMAIDSFYNKTAEVAANIRNIAFIERCGLEVNECKGQFSMDSSRIAVKNLILETPNSSVKTDLTTDMSVFRKSETGRFDVTFFASIGPNDLIYFYPELIPKNQLKLFRQPLAAQFQASGNLNKLHVDNVKISIPNLVSFAMSGYAESIMKPKQLSGRLRWKGTFNRMETFKSFIADTSVRNRIAIPNHILFNGEVIASLGTITPNLEIQADSGTIRLDGMLDNRNETYRLALLTDSLPLHRFLPHDSLGVVSISARISGTGYDPFATGTEAKMTLETQQLIYNGYDYKQLNVNANLLNHQLTANISSDSPALQFAAAINGNVRKGAYQATVSGDFKSLDFKQLNLTKDETRLSFSLATNGLLNDTTQTLQLETSVKDLVLVKKYERHKLKDIAFQAKSDSTHIAATLQAYGLDVNFNSNMSLKKFLAAIDSTSSELTAQVDSNSINIEKAEQHFPSFALKATFAKRNLINSFLKSSGTTFNQILLDAGYSKQQPLFVAVHVNGLQSNGVTLDSLTAEIRQEGARLNYYTGVGILNNNPLNLSKLIISGYLENNKLITNCFQQNKQKETGFNFESEISYQDSLIRYHMISEHPVMAFEPWAINTANYIDYHLARRLSANFQLTANDKEVSLHTNQLPDRAYPVTHLILKGIQLESVLGLFPTLPAIGGLLSAHIDIMPTPNFFELFGELGIGKFVYNKKNIGDIHLTLNGKSDENNGYLMTAGLDIDKWKAFQMNGSYHPSAEEQLSINISTPELPLNSINAFLPPNTGDLSGWLKSRFQIGGNPSRPVLNGYIHFDQAAVQVPAIGTQFTFSPDSITIKDNLLRFNKYAISAPNKQQLYIDGEVNARDFANIYTNLSLSARDFQMVNVEKNKSTMIYGKALASLNTTIVGPVNELSVNGNIQLLNGTEVTYTLPSTSLDLKDVKQDMVTFVSFRDSTDIDEADSIPTLNIGGINVAVNIGIDNNVKMAVNLSSDGNNRINVQGGGNLSYSLNPLGDSRFSGRYNLTGGTVRYNPPIISAKLFNIQSGSFVEWVGDIANPNLNITAVQDMRSYVTENDKNGRMVNFDIIIAIKNTLENLSLTFDLKVQNDIAIQTQLATLTAEQRSVQAMNLLLYNSYSGPGTSVSTNLTDNPLNAFIQKEVNQWAQNNLKSIDFSIGIDQRKEMTNGVESQSTNYSYKLSKTLFNDRFKIILGGGFDSNEDANSNLQENLINDISLEYMLDKRNSMFIKLFRETNYESILEGEVIQTGAGFVVRKKLQKLKYLFRLRDRRNTNETK